MIGTSFILGYVTARESKKKKAMILTNGKTEKVYCDVCGKYMGEFIINNNTPILSPPVHCLACSKKANLDKVLKELRKPMQKDLIPPEVVEAIEKAQKKMEEKAKRENISVRYDLLIPEFLEEMARLASHGAEKYGDRNWQASRLVGEKSPLNHLHQHLNQFQQNKDHDFFKEKRGHLVSVAFNAMMEWWYESHGTPE